jgi:CRP/FNR family transcriptional regulator, cyclic AMP receptor protein
MRDVYCRRLIDSALGDIAAYVRPRKFERGDLVIAQGAPGSAVMFLFSGRLQQTSLQEDGREVGLGFIEAGECLGLGDRRS